MMRCEFEKKKEKKKKKRAHGSGFSTCCSRGMQMSSERGRNQGGANVEGFAELV